MQPEIIIVGGGLAGSEAAWQAARRGVRVTLWEMRPKRMTPAHHTGAFAELVCSNSFRAQALENAVGLLKEEMRRLGSVIMECADKEQVPAGGALAVDRQGFAACVTERVRNHPLVTVEIGEVTAIPPREQPVVIATGPLTTEDLTEDIKTLTGEDHLYFYDAAAPIVTLESLDKDVIFRASRYGKGEEEAYINCPLTREEYERLWEALVAGEVYEGKDFEEKRFFEGCMPVEELARRGRDTLRYGPLKPVGLKDPRTGKHPYAVVQLRQDNREGTLYNMVGFQTRLKWGEQKRIFSLIPGLEQAEFVRYGVMHRNTFISAPRVLRNTYQYRGDEMLFFAGQITGVEGYVESAASGLVAGINAARMAKGQKPLTFPLETAHGALANYITTANPQNFQPMNINFGLFPPLQITIKNRRERNRALAERALASLGVFSKNLEI
ncbi:MAG TPA: FADH(2)-oxidizing methylenetetrahydrofolate--tRNA-(uracil(54)-C(5))-methyltransferase TrmFO [Firmicutes bacterium]|nr:FADH(2)-oxidizing methylenetetrahydrofolate--tRNA-(uracil(54)-C(5))-methyltransferase TrmFO [Bacillota bacterium]